MDFPAPLTPTSPSRCPGAKRKVTSSKSFCFSAGVVALEVQGDAFKVQHVLAEPGGCHLAERHRVARIGNIGDQLVGGFDAELRLRSARRGAPAQPRQFLLDELLPLAFDDGRAMRSRSARANT